MEESLCRHQHVFPRDFDAFLLMEKNVVIIEFWPGEGRALRV